MKPNQFEELFRRNEYKLNERPGPHVWDRLEKRLDKKRRRSVWAFRNTLGMVAALAGLIVVLFLLTITANPIQEQTAYKPQQLETLSGELATDYQTTKLVKLSHQYYSNVRPFPEGSGQKALKSRVEVESGD